MAWYSDRNREKSILPSTQSMYIYGLHSFDRNDTVGCIPIGMEYREYMHVEGVDDRSGSILG